MSPFGIARSRQRTHAPADASELAEVAVLDVDDRELRLGELWKDEPAALVFLRHYGCTHCRSHAVRLHRDREELEAAGVRLAVIGQGTPKHARHFAETQNVDLPMYTSADRDAYRAAGTKIATLGELLGPKSVAKGLRRSAADRVHQGRVVGHPAQLGGVLIVMPDGSIPYAHLSEDASDNAPNDEVLEAAREAVSRARGS